MAELTMVKALNLALHQAMEADDRVVVCGQDVGIDERYFLGSSAVVCISKR